MIEIIVKKIKLRLLINIKVLVLWIKSETMTQQIAKKNDLIKKLEKGVVSISFTKKDGTLREMACTLDTTIIPDEFAPKGVERTKPVDSLSVFDVEKNEWRSFRWDSLISVN